MHHLVPLMTLEEKASLLSGATFWNTVSVPRLGIEAVVLTDGPHGVRFQPETGDHLGVSSSKPATAFPTAAATGSSWDPALLREMGEALGRESRAQGVDVLLGPGVNIKRSPLCGRSFEYFSEDPVLSGALGAAWVKGIQSLGVGASVKHFAANSQETERMRVSAEVDERTLREIYLPAFETVVRESQPATVMCSYNRINGVYASENGWLLTDVLRRDWGFEGYVVSDWGAVTDPVRAVAAGTDLTMPASDRHASQVLAAVSDGTLDVQVLDDAVSRILSVHDQLRAGRDGGAVVDLDAHHQLARRIAAESSVLLVNDDGLLPLAPEGGPIAVVGEFARTPRYQGAGSSHIVPTRLDNALDAITEASNRPVVFAPGFRLDGGEDDELVAEALDAARAADVTVLFLGLPPADESEGFDRDRLDLPQVQLGLLDRLLEVTARVVVVLSNGAVVDLTPLAGRVPAILETWLGGQASGSATADMLFGVVEPGGRLAETVPMKLSDTPAFLNWPGTPERVLHGERIYVGYRWYDATQREVLFPFGHGLGYTTFELGEVEVTVPDPTSAYASVEVSVTNTGERAGAEVVQVYVGDPVASVDRPVRELKGFAKVRLDPGETRRVRIELDERAFAYWADGWTVEPGEFLVEVGVSSRDIRALERIELRVPPPVRHLDEGSTVAEWLSHPVGAVVLTDALAENTGTGAQMLGEEEFRRMIGSMPLRTLLGFNGGAESEAAVSALLVAVSQHTASA